MADENLFLPLVEKFFEHDITLAAHSLEVIETTEAVKVLQSLPPSVAAKAIKHLQVSYSAELPKNSDTVLFGEIVSSLDPQLAATIFMHLPQDTRTRLLDLMSEKQKNQIRELLTYPENSVGRIMTTDFLSFHKDITA